jgi:hypothetical protein
MKPKANTEQCELLAFLLDDGQWHKGRTLQMNNRMIRAACAEQPHRFISGQSGYKLAEFASVRELNIAVRDLRSRAACLRRRATAIEEGRYRRFVDNQITDQEALL